MLLLALALLILFNTVGCKTSGPYVRTEADQKAYTQLTPTDKDAVDRHLLREGMNQEAVRLSWGRPSEVRKSSDSDKNQEEWLYEGLRWADVPTWYYHHSQYGMPALDFRRERRGEPYTRARVLFENGYVVYWEKDPNSMSW